MKKRVMLIDDEKLILDFATLALRSIGVEDIKVYQSARAAFADYSAAKKSKPFDLIVSDWQMPEMTGLELLKKIREDDLETPFIMLTATSDKAMVMEAIELKVTDYISKPFQIEQLASKISKLFEE